MSKNLCQSLKLPKRSLKYSGIWGVCTYEESGNALWPVGGVNLQQEVLLPVFCSFSSHPYLSSEIKWTLPYLTPCLWEANGWSESTSLFLFSLAHFCTRVCLPALPQWLEFHMTWIRILTPWFLSHLTLESGMSLRSLICMQMEVSQGLKGMIPEREKLLKKCKLTWLRTVQHNCLLFF